MTDGLLVLDEVPMIIEFCKQIDFPVFLDWKLSESELADKLDESTGCACEKTIAYSW